MAKKFLETTYPSDIGTEEQWKAWRDHQQRVLDELFPVVRDTTSARQYKDAQAFNKAHGVLVQDHFTLEVGTHVALAEMKNVNKNKPLYVGRYEIAAVTDKGDYLLVKRGLDPCIKENLYHRVVKLDELKVIPRPQSCVEAIVDQTRRRVNCCFGCESWGSTRMRICGFQRISLMLILFRLSTNLGGKQTTKQWKNWRNRQE